VHRGLRTARCRPLAACAALSVFAVSAQAVETLSGSVQTITAEDWRVDDLAFGIRLSESGLAGEIRIGRLELTAAKTAFDDVLVTCEHLELYGVEFSCLDAVFTIDLPGVGRATFPGEARYDRGSGEVRFELRDVPVAGGRLNLAGTAGTESIDAAFAGSALQVTGLAGILEALDLMPEGMSAPAGTAELSGSYRTRNGAPAGLAVGIVLAGASVSNEPGTVVAEAVDGRLDVTAETSPDGWRVEARIAAEAGEAYVEPVYADLAQTPLKLAASGNASPDFRSFDVEELALEQGTLVSASAAFSLDLPGAEEEAPVVRGRFELADSSFEAIYANLLQVFAAGTMLGDLETSGTISGVVSLEENRITSAVLTMRDLNVDDRQQRFAAYGLNGVVHWPGPGSEAAASETSHIGWDGASAYDIPFGAGRIEARLGGDDLELLEPLRVPVLGGTLLVNRLSMHNYGKEDASGLLDAELEPVELGRLTAAFGWPAFSGELSGQLPLLQYEGEVVTVGGTLTAKAFDGDIAFENLRLEQPFGLVPRLSGDLRLRQLDLEQVTDTFSFGLIQGRLSGDVTGLQMIAWRPVAMDLHLYTPVGDKSRRRISQRAVENLASVGGGGAAAALSSGFMSFFEVFAYEKIGIRCILADGVCRMSGAEAAGEGEFGQGYYIVKGSGLPRIDVVGYRRQVSWTQLLNQLTAITQSGGPIVD
jgi:hypothetical protein